MTSERSRNNLPIPDPQHVGVTTFDAKDPDTAFPAMTSFSQCLLERFAELCVVSFC